MKTKIEVQFQERNVDVKDTEKLVKEDLKASECKKENENIEATEFTRQAEKYFGLGKN